MSHFYAASGCVFHSASEALEKYLKDFETTTGIDLVERSERSCRNPSADPKSSSKSDDSSTNRSTSASLIDRIAATSETAMVPYMIQKMAQRAVSSGYIDHYDVLSDDDDHEDGEDAYIICEKSKTKQVYICPNQPVTTYRTESPPPFDSKPNETYGSLYADLRRIKEHISNRYWTRTPHDDRRPLSSHFEACKLIEDLKMINGNSDGDETERDSLNEEDLRIESDTERLSLSVNRNTVTNSEVTSVSPLNTATSALSHDSGMNSPALPSSGARESPPWAVPWNESEILKPRKRHDTCESSMSLASSTSRISEPKILSSTEKERIRSRLCELDSMPKPIFISTAFR